LYQVANPQMLTCWYCNHIFIFNSNTQNSWNNTKSNKDQ